MLLSIVLISKRRSVREPGFPVRRARPCAWPGRAHGVQFLICPLPLEDVWPSAESPRITEKFMKTRLLIFGLMLALATPLALADEGMWFKKNFPKNRARKQKGFLPRRKGRAFFAFLYPSGRPWRLPTKVFCYTTISPKIGSRSNTAFCRRRNGWTISGCRRCVLIMEAQVRSCRPTAWHLPDR